MNTTTARDLTPGATVVIDGHLHTVATVEDSWSPDRLVFTFTDGCHMYAVRDDQPFTLA